MSGAAITGLGAVSGLGIGVTALWDGLCAGARAVRRYPALAQVELDIGPVAKVLLPDDAAELGGERDDGRALLGGRPRASAMALLAAEEALHDAGLLPRPGPPFRLGISIGTTLGEKAPWLQRLRARWGQLAAPAAGELGASAPARVLARHHEAACWQVTSTACASANVALGTALSWVRAGRCDVVLCGGVDALSEFVLSGFIALRAHAKEPCRPFDRERSGLNLGEGAAFLILESAEHARRRGRRIRAYLDGCGLSCDANHMTGPDRQGRGAARAMVAALRDAGLAPQSVDFVSAHGTATGFNDAMEARGLELVLGGRSGQVPVNSIKGTLGHTLGAAGALEAVMAVRVLEDQLIPPTAGHIERDPEIALDVVAGAPRAARIATVLSTSSGFGGVNAALVLRRGDLDPAVAARSSQPGRATPPIPCAVMAAAVLLPRSDEPLGPLLPPGAPQELGGQLQRMDRLCALAACATERALAGRWNLRQAPAWPAERIGVIVGTDYGCHKTDEEYYRTVLARQPSPRLFAYTLPSSPVGELSILHRLRGPGLAVVGTRAAGLQALAQACALLQADQAAACLVVAVEVASPAIVEKEPGTEKAAVLADAAVALLLTRADALPPGAEVAFGYVLGTATAHETSRLQPALRQVARDTLSEAQCPAGALATVMCDAATQPYLPPELPGAAAAAALPAEHGAAAALQAILELTAADEPGCALILGGDPDGQAAGCLWSRSRR